MCRVEVLCSPGCLNAARTIRDLRRLIAQERVNAEVIITLVHTEAEAVTLRFPGTPTVQIDGEDVEPANQVELPHYSLDCRVYWYDGQFWARPPEQMLRQAFQRV